MLVLLPVHEHACDGTFHKHACFVMLQAAAGPQLSFPTDLPQPQLPAGHTRWPERFGLPDRLANGVLWRHQLSQLCKHMTASHNLSRSEPAVTNSTFSDTYQKKLLCFMGFVSFCRKPHTLCLEFLLDHHLTLPPIRSDPGTLPFPCCYVQAPEAAELAWERCDSSVDLTRSNTVHPSLVPVKRKQIITLLCRGTVQAAFNKHSWISNRRVSGSCSRGCYVLCHGALA